MSEITLSSSRLFECTTLLRFFASPARLGVPTLQQAWRCRQTGEVWWRDVETVTGEFQPPEVKR